MWTASTVRPHRRGTAGSAWCVLKGHEPQPQTTPPHSRRTGRRGIRRRGARVARMGRRAAGPLAGSAVARMGARLVRLGHQRVGVLSILLLDARPTFRAHLAAGSDRPLAAESTHSVCCSVRHKPNSIRTCIRIAAARSGRFAMVDTPRARRNAVRPVIGSPLVGRWSGGRLAPLSAADTGRTIAGNVAW